MDYWDLVDPVWEKISIYDGAEIFLREYMAAPEAARLLFAAHWCQSEICNGGFGQFFFNSTGILAPEAVDAFNQLGMPQAAAVVESAMQLLGASYPRERDAREKLLERISSDDAYPFKEHDKRFYALLESEAGGFELAADTYAQHHGG